MIRPQERNPRSDYDVLVCAEGAFCPLLSSSLWCEPIVVFYQTWYCIHLCICPLLQLLAKQHCVVFNLCGIFVMIGVVHLISASLKGFPNE